LLTTKNPCFENYATRSLFWVEHSRRLVIILLERKHPSLRSVQDFTVKTFLRPDYYEYFPRFCNAEIAARMTRMSFAQATLLGLYNIEKGILAGSVSSRVLKEFLLSPVEFQIRQMSSVLTSVGISERVAAAMSRVPRHLYCPSRDEAFAYLDASVSYDSGSCVSSPSIVALMLDRLNPRPGMRFLDVGCGSCYHAHCVSELCSHDCEICGIEINEGFLSLARSALAQTKIRTIETAHADLRNGWPKGGQFDGLYGAIAIEKGLPDRLLHQVIEGGSVQLARALTEEEFLSEPEHSWLSAEFGDYVRYRRSWRSFCCLVTGKRSGNQIVESDRLYDVTFVPLRSNQQNNTAARDPFEPIRRILTIAKTDVTVKA
jgi:protein-L-isoaspartate(D-aspartate) O-methyltransferase